MEDGWRGQPVVRQLRHSLPRDSALLTASGQDPAPAFGDLGAERREGATICRHRVVVEVAFDDPPQPFTLDGNRLVHAPPQRLLDLLELGPHAVAPDFPVDQEFTLAGFAADEGEAQEVEGLRLTKPTPLAVE